MYSLGDNVIRKMVGKRVNAQSERRVLAVMVAAALLPGVIAVGAASAATPKANGTCAKVGQTASAGSQTLVCTKVGSKNLWKASAATTHPPVTSAVPTTAAAPTTAPATAGKKAADSSLAPVKIGLVNVDSGSPSFPDVNEGAKAAVKYMNAELGGVNGHPVELVVCSAGFDVQSNQKCGQQFANDESIKLVITCLLFNPGSMYSALTASNTPVLGRIPLTAPDFTNKNTYFYGSGTLSNNGLAYLLLDKFKYVHSVGFIISDTSAGRAGVVAMKGILTAGGVTNFKDSFVNEASPDVSGAITALGKVDAIYVGLTAPTCLQLAQNAGIIPAGTVMVGPGSCITGDVFLKVKGAQENWTFVSGEVPIEAGKGVRPDLDTFLDKCPQYGCSATPGRFVSPYWGHLLTTRAILEGIGFDKLTKATINSTLAAYKGSANMGVPSVSCPGNADYPTICATTLIPYVIKNGKPVVAYPGYTIDLR